MPLLVHHLRAHHHAGSVQQWHLWENARSADDVAFLNGLEGKFGFVKIVRFPSDCPRKLKGTNVGIVCFWRDATVQKTLFGSTIIRLDDDVVWLDTPARLRAWVAFTRAHEQYMFTAANVLNNAMSLHFMQHHCDLLSYREVWKPGRLYLPPETRTHAGFSSWYGGPAVDLHREVLRLGPDTLRCDKSVEMNAERISINAIAWHGPHLARHRPGVLPHYLGNTTAELKELLERAGVEATRELAETAMTKDEELEFTARIPAAKKLASAWYGGFVAAHYSFGRQEALVSSAPDIMQGYQRLADAVSTT